MNHPYFTIVIPTHNRAHLFKRSLECYAHQKYKDFEIILLDDGSTDNMEFLCKGWAQALGLDLKYFWFRRPGGFRDGASIINYGIRAANGDVIVTTSPEVMPGLTSLSSIRQAVESRGGWITQAWFSCKCYIISPAQQALIDTVDWRGHGATAAVRALPGFYEAPSAEYTGGRDYVPAVIDGTPVFHASLFCAMTRIGWKNIGGFPECETWGSPDPSFMGERLRRQIECVTVQDSDSICVHQNHDGPEDEKTPRDPQKCVQNLIAGPWNFIRW